MFTTAVYLIVCLASFGPSASESKNVSKEEEKQVIEEAIRQLQSPKGQPKAPSPFEDFSEVSGLIVDRTITRLGEDFYFFFSQKLNDRYPNFEENLTVVEIPTALSGSIIEVKHSRKVIFRTALSPGRRQAQDRAGDALRVVGNYMVRWEAQRLLQDTYDLDHDEF